MIEEAMLFVVKALQKYLEEFDVPEGDTLMLLFKPAYKFTAQELREILEVIHDADPDELDVDEDGWLRLWWD